MCKIAIEVNDLDIYYDSIKGFSVKRDLFGKNKSRFERFHAVKKVSFQLKVGEILGIVGKNGSGKSTLLRALAGVFSADAGSIDLNGNSISLLSIGVGFESSLSGRENVFLSGMLLGFTEEEINKKMKDIIDFSELEEFIDKPVRTYSSGMYSKLAFAITVNLDTDIILIDEVLSVGDEKFSKKSYRRMKKMIEEESRTVIIVSHTIPVLAELCNKVMWMHEGEVIKIGDTCEVLSAYKKFMEEC